ncbi:hypothetical protein [Novosphingobium malaysiense]|uniref:Uncharacterized protein n=1 Tax=Novosphingobium malaysiense TaxID=1348853 RepID=A0A0B1ZW00_9SPHN|nr:hypothetical protein [Novosphingobium malaysiense]KHK93363.1 hypothetical protein LK12_03460 [Novosphingobium malaysiense]
MGTDFKEKSKKSFEKCWDNAALDANTPDLFSKTPDRAPNRFEAEALGNAQVEIGESVAVRMEGDRLIGRRGISPVLVIASPSPTLIQSVEQGCNIARADIVAADPISGVFEVTIS